MMSRLAAIWCLLVACGSEPEFSVPDRSTAAAAFPGLDAPDRSIFGLSLDEAFDSDVSDWLSERGLHCPESPSPARTTTHYTCSGKLDATALPERRTRGVLSSLLIARPDEGPVHHLSVRHKYSFAEVALEEYRATRDILRDQLGPPSRGDEPEAVDLESPLIRYVTQWRYADLEVTLAVLRVGNSGLTLSEQWMVPGVESLAKSRVDGRSGATTKGAQ